MSVCNLVKKSKMKSGSSEFKCGSIRGQLGLGGGMFSAECL